MWKKILIGVVALIAILCVVVGFQPSTYHIERSITIQAPAAVVVPICNVPLLTVVPPV